MILSYLIECTAIASFIWFSAGYLAYVWNRCGSTAQQQRQQTIEQAKQLFTQVIDRYEPQPQLESTRSELLRLAIQSAV